MTNLLKETLHVLEQNGKETEDVAWCGSENYGYLLWSEFAAIAEYTDYDNGYGAPESATDLVVVGQDWWLAREEYDGSEGWDFRRLPKRPGGNNKIRRLKTHDIGWDSVLDING